MSETPYVNKKALGKLNTYRSQLTRQQFKTLRGQILNGNDQGAMKGLQRLIDGGLKENCEHSHLEKRQNSAIITA